MLTSMGKMPKCSIFVAYLEKFKISYDKSI